MKTNSLVRSLLVAGIVACSATVCQAQSTNLLYGPPASPATGSYPNGRDNYTGVVGCSFKPTTYFVVTHLGFYSTNTTTGLATSHQVGLFIGGGANNPPLYGQVVVPAGTNGLWVSNVYWVALSQALLLTNNSTYMVAGSVVSGDGDPWHDGFNPGTWNSSIVQSASVSGGVSVYGPGNSTAWPPPSLGNNAANNTYGNVDMGNFPIGPAQVVVASTNVSATVGTTLTVLGFGAGQYPLSYQWYESPGTPVSGQTNATMVISNVPQSASGTYYLIASNSLGSQQSSNITVSITAIPVSISQQPTNATVYQNYNATFTVGASGSQPLSYQWSRNGTPISGATASSYILSGAAMSNNGDNYSCQVTNAISSTNTANASLTVVPNLAPPAEYLHGALSGANHSAYSGLLGGLFTTGNSPTLVSHLGWYATNSTSQTLVSEHHVGIFSGDGSNLLASVDIQAGTYNVTNGYIWAQLNPPFILSPNTTYALLADVTGNDPMGDAYSINSINPFYAGTNAFSAIYTGTSWPTGQPYYGRYGGDMYAAPNMALLAMGVTVGVMPTNVSQYAGVDQTLSALVGGQPPITGLQWYEEPGTALAGDTNLVADLGNLTTNQSGSYYLVASNTVTSATGQSQDAIVTVLADNPSITNNPVSEDGYHYQTIQFTAGISGRPPLSYQWTFDGNAIAGATNSVLTLRDVSAANDGTYQLIVSNAYGVAASSTASLQVSTPVWGGYASGVMTTNLLFYYRFNDISNYVNNAVSTVVNQGSVGPSANGTYQGGCTEIAGPTNIMDLDNGTNLAVNFDGYDADILVPSENVTVTNCTIAAWVYDAGNPQAPNAGIFFHRQANVLGLSVNPDANNIDQLRGTWGGYHDSGIELPANQWVLVAMAVTPTNMAFYLDNGSNIVSTNVSVANASASFNGVSYIGYDSAQTSRLWNGGLDEVMVFNTALNASQVNSLYLGVPQSATLTVTPAANGKLTITWPGGTLLEATNLSGPWTATAGASNGVYTVTPSGTSKYYRVKLQ